MRKNYHCVKLTDEVESIVKEYIADKNIGISEGINNLILEGIRNNYDSNQIVSMTDGIKKVLSRTYYLKVLMEQLYSDFNIDEPSNPKNNIGLKKVQDRVKKSYDE